MVKLNNMYNLGWCGLLYDYRGCRENALQSSLLVHHTMGLYYSFYTNMVGIDSNYFNMLQFLLIAT